MIEKLKQRPNNLNPKNLAFVESWWDKKLLKNKKQIERYLSRFGRNDILTNTTVLKKQEIDYQQYLEFSNKTLEFILQKEKQMAREIRIVQKLRKMVASFAEQAGILAFLQGIDQYYDEINKIDTIEKKELAIKIGNKTILKIYDEYKIMLLKFFNKEAELKNKILALYETDKISEKILFDGSTTINFLFRFVGTAFRKNKILKEDFSQIYFNTIFIDAYLALFHVYIIDLLLKFFNKKKAISLLFLLQFLNRSIVFHQPNLELDSLDQHH